MFHSNDNGNSDELSADHRLRVILVRHGESQNNLYHEISLKMFEENRVADPAISERGQQQAQSVADYLQKRTNVNLSEIDEIHVSPMRRTLQTAAPIAKALPSVPVHVVTDIFEISGVYEGTVGKPGMTRSEMQRDFPTYQLPESVTEKGWYPLESKESYEHGQQRCIQVWQRICTMADNLTENRCILMVVHGDFMDSLLQAAFGFLPLNGSTVSPPTKEKIWVFPSWNTAITALDIRSSDKNKRPTLLFHNSVAHLDPRLVKTDKLGKC